MYAGPMNSLIPVRKNLPNTVWILFQGPSEYLPNVVPAASQKFNVVVSTWRDKSLTEDLLQELKQINPDVKILASAKPIISGPGNINLQAESTKRGLRYIRDLGGKNDLVLKIRSDFRFSNWDKAIDILIDEYGQASQRLSHSGTLPPVYVKILLKLAKSLSHSSRIQNRILGALRFAPIMGPILFLDYSLHRRGYFLDFVSFGHFEEQTLLWGIPKKYVGLFKKGGEEFLIDSFRRKFRSVGPGRQYLASGLVLGALVNGGVVIEWIKRGITSEAWKGHRLWVDASRISSPRHTRPSNGD
jgi:hypothetical protein